MPLNRAADADDRPPEAAVPVPALPRTFMRAYVRYCECTARSPSMSDLFGFRPCAAANDASHDLMAARSPLTSVLAAVSVDDMAYARGVDVIECRQLLAQASTPGGRTGAR